MTDDILSISSINYSFGSLYILVDKEPIKETNFSTWANWFSNNDRRIGLDTFDDGTIVSTVFLGISYGYDESYHPILFETMIFSKDRRMDEFQYRYSTWDEAERGHKSAVQAAKLYGKMATLADRKELGNGRNEP